MKFGKELASQMVPEWQGAHMDYDNLTKLLKDILRFRQQNGVSSSGPMALTGSLKRNLTMYRSFSGLTSRYNNLRGGSPRKNEEEVILVGSVGSEIYQRMFLRSSDAGGEYELMFFKELDAEFNKVVKFYKEKVQEVKGKAEELSKQMDALIALRITVDKPAVVQKFASEVNAESSSGYSGHETVVASVNGVKPGKSIELIQGVEMSSERASGNRCKSSSLDVLGQVMINIDPETPISTLRNCIMSSKSDVSSSKEELRKVQEKLRQAFVEFYQQLRLLKSYCFLNMLAFSKIMKKFDKVQLGYRCRLGSFAKKLQESIVERQALVPNKAVYFVAIVVNILLRLAWMQLVLDIQDTPFLHRKAMIALVASLEILLRGIWNFFRLENEHLNNVGRYRAFKHVPLPFHHADEKIM